MNKKNIHKQNGWIEIDVTTNFKLKNVKKKKERQNWMSLLYYELL